MSEKQKRLIWPSLFGFALLIGVLLLIVVQTRAGAGRDSAALSRTDPAIQQQKEGRPQTPKNRSRNLSLQPEALKMAQRLGRRFAATTKEQSVLNGSLTIGGERRSVQILRKQRDDGEEVAIELSGSDRPLTWDSARGAMASNAVARDGERELVERLVLDSPDQFVLAQLRGASYFTVARNVRPVDADESYAGPLWDIVRVDNPRSDETQADDSWRLYYVNVRTGLIDKIVSQHQGQAIEAKISGWSDMNGEQVPAAITWTAAGQIVMQFQLNNFTHDKK